MYFYLFWRVGVVEAATIIVPGIIVQGDSTYTIESPKIDGRGRRGGGGMPRTKTYVVDEFVSGIDADEDGFMAKEEFKAVGLTDRMWTFCDPDGDAQISKAELGDYALPEAVDMNKDGKLSVEEVVAFEGTDLGHERGPGEPKPE